MIHYLLQDKWDSGSQVICEHFREIGLVKIAVSLWNYLFVLNSRYEEDLQNTFKAQVNRVFRQWLYDQGQHSAQPSGYCCWHEYACHLIITSFFISKHSLQCHVWNFSHLFWSQMCGMSLCAKPSILLRGISADGNEHEVRQGDYPKERFCAKLECDHFWGVITNPKATHTCDLWNYWSHSNFRQNLSFWVIDFSNFNFISICTDIRTHLRRMVGFGITDHTRALHKICLLGTPQKYMWFWDYWSHSSSAQNLSFGAHLRSKGGFGITDHIEFCTKFVFWVVHSSDFIFISICTDWYSHNWDLQLSMQSGSELGFSANARR